MRVAGVLVEDDRVEVKKAMLDAYPELRAMYDENDGNTQVLYFYGGTATFSAFGKSNEVIEFLKGTIIMKTKMENRIMINAGLI